MKVARVEHAEGPSVLKVFLPQDPSFSIDPYRDQVCLVDEKVLDLFRDSNLICCCC